MKEIHLERCEKIPVEYRYMYMVHGRMDGTTRVRERTCMNTPVLRLGNNFIRVQYYTRIGRNKNPKLIQCSIICRNVEYRYVSMHFRELFERLQDRIPAISVNRFWCEGGSNLGLLKTEQFETFNVTQYMKIRAELQTL